MKLFLHICCAPCLIYPLAVLGREGFEPTGYFYNPNIHPYREFLRRKDTLTAYAQGVALPVLYEPGYPLEWWMENILGAGDKRCETCVGLRLKETAKKAREMEFETFTTTLLYSIYQKHDQIRELGIEIGREAGIPFYYQDFRKGWKEGVLRSRELKLYRQPYCGCIFSERDRYFKGG
jgi:predicted adenine nucleotide alpha hydrolase (AANH) superfamily ATPase